MQAQWVFGNPQTRKKLSRGLAANEKRSDTKAKGKGNMAKKRAKKKQNPFRYVFEGKDKKGRKITKKGRVFNMGSDAAEAASKMGAYKGKKDVTSRQNLKRLRAVVKDVAKGRSRKLAVKEKNRILKRYYSERLDQVTSPIGSLKASLVKVPSGKTRKAKKTSRKKTVKKTAKRKKAKMVAAVAPKKSAAKKISRKKKSVKKKLAKSVAKKAVTVAKKKSKKKVKKAKKTAKRVAKKAAKKKKTKSVKRKAKTSRPRKAKNKKKTKVRKNPYFGGSMNKLEQLLAHSMRDAAGLALGGATFGAINGLATKIPVVRDIQKKLVKIPVVGTSLVPILAGALLNKIGEKKSIPALKMAGRGLIGAGIVNVGVAASQMVPALKAAPMAGIPAGMGEDDLFDDGADYGEDADYGAVVMEGIPAGMGEDADYGEVEFFPNEMQGIPEGMGEVEFFPNESVG